MSPIHVSLKYFTAALLYSLHHVMLMKRIVYGKNAFSIVCTLRQQQL